MDSKDLLAIFNALDDTEDVRAECIRAPFGYVGGKSQSYRHILDYLPYRRSFIEVFGGSGIVILNRRKSQLDVYNDRYGGVVAFYRCLRDKDKIEQLIARLELTVHAKEEFYWCRDTWDNCDDDVERAARWYYMIASSFIAKGQQWARGTKGISIKTGFQVHRYFKLFYPIHERLKEIQIENLNWLQCMKDYDNEDAVFYCDPPYLDVTNSYKTKFTRQDHIQLLETIMDMKGFVALSGYPSELYESYTWDDCYEWKVTVTSKGQAFTQTNNKKDFVNEGYDKVTENLWIKE